MVLPDVDREEGFSFIWTIQNYDYGFRNIPSWWKHESPTFVLNKNDKEQWCLRVDTNAYYHQDNFEFILQRSSSDRRVELTLELAIRTATGMFKKVLEKKLFFDLNSEDSRIGKLTMTREEWDAYLNKDSLTIRCRIWKLDDEVLTSAQCYAQTTIDAERAAYTWDLEGFGEFESRTRITKQVLFFNTIPSFTIDFATDKDEYDKYKIQIDIKQIETLKSLFCTCKISLVDANGKIAHTVRNNDLNRDVHRRVANEDNSEDDNEDNNEDNDEDNNEDSSDDVWTFPFIQVSEILRNKKLYLPNGILRVHCEFIVSAGDIYNKVERTEYGIMNNQTTESNFSGCLKDNLQRFYAEGKFTDLTIRSPNKEFLVHKTILCARSDVFSAMFERHMKEAQTGVVPIEDIDDDTVSKMLLFLYTDTVEDLEFGSAASLYFAADKYGIVALKRKCSEFLKGTFTVSKVCDVLVLADMHQDQELKSAAQKFIFEHSGEIMESEEWKKVMENQLPLASETMHLFIRSLKV